MKRTIFTMSAALCLAFSSVLLSCDGIAQKINGGGQANPSEAKEFIISGTLSLEGAVPSEIASVFRNETGNENGNARTAANENARTAVPTIPSTFYYKVLATEAGGKTVQVEGNGNSFTIKLSIGTWTLNAEGFSSSSMTTSTKILEGTSSSIILNNASPVNNNISITLSPISSGNGTVELNVGWENASNIKSAKMTFTESPDKSKTLTSSTSSGDFTGTFNFTAITSGIHKVKIEFFSGSNENETLLYSTHEIINVFSNLTTNTWQESAPYFTDTGGKTEFKITKTLIDDFLPKTFYVQGTGGTYTPQTTASDSNSGTYFDPFATLQKAVEKVKSINDKTSAYKIYVDGTLEGTSADFNSGNKNALAYIDASRTLNLTIEGLKGSGNTSGAKIDAKRTASENGRVFYIVYATASGSSITIKNLTITGGYLGSTSEHGAGIYVNGNLTLSGVTVTGNTSQSNGGGIYAHNTNVTLILNENTTVSNNSAGSYGGGIFANMNTTLNITDATITGNSASSNGGGIYLYNAEATLNNANITNNKGTSASSKGGGIYMSSSGKNVQITGGTISGNNSVQEGGGIYLYEGILSLKDATIVDNSATNDGKSIYAYNKGTINFAGSTVTTSLANTSTEYKSEKEEDVYLFVSTSNEFAKIHITEALSRSSYPKSSDKKDVACYLKFANNKLQTLNGQTIIQESPTQNSISKFYITGGEGYYLKSDDASGGKYKGVLTK